ncbi:hypothetical protein GCM10008090_10270 [Arenicella chitinivorans]|uniref:Uncharacterized protein n=1 Tax=Arenicella chitinivorans TaxID=1329800 RepID=A0A918VI46_9GAMM|nr:hypothetical protein [Arenicella chitinivorans]GHA03225.1 hypothetical protein GCM10008090_10270 [Arenicella chitinivorans]
MKSDSFTEEELNYIKELSLQQSTLKQVYFYACVLIAPLAFAIYGFINSDVLAMLIAFLGLMVFVAWFLSQSLSGGRLLNVICQKIVQNLESSSNEQ